MREYARGAGGYSLDYLEQVKVSWGEEVGKQVMV